MSGIRMIRMQNEEVLDSRLDEEMKRLNSTNDAISKMLSSISPANNVARHIRVEDLLERLERE